MRKILKATFVVAFAVAALCAGYVDAKASGIEGGPGSQTIPSKMPPCPQCGSNAAVISGLDEHGGVNYICWDCKLWFWWE